MVGYINRCPRLPAFSSILLFTFRYLFLPFSFAPASLVAHSVRHPLQFLSLPWVDGILLTGFWYGFVGKHIEQMCGAEQSNLIRIFRMDQSPSFRG